MIILNLGCGTKTSDACVNIDWSPYLRLKRNAVLRVIVLPLVGEARRKRLSMISDNILAHDLRKPLPFGEGDVDAVYHSHVLEHIDRESAPLFLADIYRVLRSDGVLRIAVPDWEFLCRAYLQNVAACESGTASLEEHESYIGDMIEQCVRKESYGSSRRGTLMRLVERVMLGDARARGETHQWMYDRFSLKTALERVGFRQVAVCSWNDSAIPEWEKMGLEIDDSGQEYKPGSLYIECRK